MRYTSTASAARSATVLELGRGPELEDVFRVLAGHRGVFFLDSAGGDSGWGAPPRFAGGPRGAWSFLGAEPVATLQAVGCAVVERKGCLEHCYHADPLEALRHFLGDIAGPEGNSIPFSGGAVGFLGYDIKGCIERLPARARRDQRFPDLWMCQYEWVLAFDHTEGIWYAAIMPLSRCRDELIACARGVIEKACRYRSKSVIELRSLPPRCYSSNMSREEYISAVRRILEYIAAGDIFQANFTRRYETSVQVPASELYLALRRRNPAPFGAYIDLGDGMAVLSSSPELFLRVRGRAVETRPIKGTRPRGLTPQEDRLRAEELLSSPKDAAELAMITDLERNDLGRVAEYGSVRVYASRELEAYPTVFHLVATVTAELAPGRDVVDLLRATFPGGSITGAPKIRAMEIIDELEPTARSVYTGAIGFIDASGDMDLNIAIRTILFDRGSATYQVGGGIVADSDPEAEHEECLAKGRALAEVLASCGAQCFSEGTDHGRT